MIVMKVSTKREDSIFSRAGCEVSLRIPCNDEAEELLGIIALSRIVMWELVDEEEIVRCRMAGLLNGGPVVVDRVVEPGMLALDTALLRGLASEGEPCSRIVFAESCETFDSTVDDLRLPRFLPRVTSRSSDR